MKDVYTTEGNITTTTKFSKQKPLAPSYLLSALQAELANMDSIYTSYKLLIFTATKLLKGESSFNGMSSFSKCTKRSILPFLGDALSWLIRTANTKDVRKIKKRVNQLIETQTHQQKILVHAISILNVTRYTTQVNRQNITAVMQAVERTQNDVTTLFNITISTYTCINYQLILLPVHSILANLRDSLYCMRQIAMHALDYIDATTTGILLPHIFQVDYLREMLMHIKAQLPTTMHLPVNLDDTLHFYCDSTNMAAIIFTDHLFLINLYSFSSIFAFIYWIIMILQQY